MSTTVSPKIYDVLKKVVNESIENFTVSVHDANKKGEGYLGEVFFISLQNKSNGKQLHFVVKQAFSEDSIREQHPIRDVFLNEIYFYTKLWPKFLKFQERISPAYTFSHLPKCFAAISEDNSERLVLENLKYQGFQMHEKKKALEKDKLEFIFKVYGRFHAISFAYKALDPEEFSELAGGALEIWKRFFEKPFFKDAITAMHQQCLDSLQPGVDDAVIEKFKGYIADGVEIFHKSHINGKYTAITHGDCWSNNMMFKYNNSGKLIDVRFLDFQLFKLASPVCDLAYCLYSGGTKDTFDDLDHLLQVYHDSLSESLRAYGCDPNDLYPLEALKEDWKRHCHMGVTMAFMIWRGKLTYDDDVIDLTDMSGDMEQDKQKFYDSKYDINTFKERTRDIILHLYENNFM